MEKNSGSNEANYTGGRQTLSLFSVAQILGGLHSRADVSLLLMVIRLVPHGDFLFHELPEPFAVDDQAGWQRWRRRIPDNLSHVAEEAGSAE